jgi:hypothetical protein
MSCRTIRNVCAGFHVAVLLPCRAWWDLLVCNQSACRLNKQIAKRLARELLQVPSCRSSGVAPYACTGSPGPVLRVHYGDPARTFSANSVWFVSQASRWREYSPKT